MSRNDRSVEDDLIIFALGALVLLVALGAVVWVAAQACLLVTEQRLLDPASGSMLDAGPRIVSDPSHPARAFARVDRAHLPGGAWLYVIAGAILVGAVALGAYAVQRITLPSLRSPRRGDGHWARPAELSPLRVADAGEGRLVLGRVGRALVATQQHHSVIVFGPTGSGKTTALVVPALLEHSGPAVALSVKTDLVADTISHRTSVGPVFVYDPLSLTGLPGASWTPLRACVTWPEAQRMAEALTSAVGDTGLSENRFWDAMAAKMLEVLLHAAALAGLTMRDVVRWVDTREQTEVVEILARHDAEHAKRSWAASQDREARTLANVYASTEVMLRAWASPTMTDCTIADSIDPAQIIAENGTLYVCAPTEDQARLRPVFAALVKDMLRSATLSAERDGPLDPSLLVVLDEAANIAPLHDLAEIAATCRAHGIQLITVFQDLAQVTARYKARAGTVVNNHTAKLLLPGTSDRDLLELMTRLLGEHSTQEVTHSHSNTGTSRTDSTRYRPLAAINELRQLPHGTALLLYGNLPPAKLALRPFFRDPTLSRLAHPKDAA